jgi:hypothetical protein
MQTLMITSVTHHQQRFSTRNINVNGRNNVAPITQDMIEAHDAYLKETLKQECRCTESWFVNACVFTE